MLSHGRHHFGEIQKHGTPSSRKPETGSRPAGSEPPALQMATERPSAALAGPCTKFLYDLVRVYPALTLDLSTNAPPPASANPCPEARVLNRGRHTLPGRREAASVDRIRRRDAHSQFVPQVVRNVQRAARKKRMIGKLRYLLYGKRLPAEVQWQIRRDDTGIV